MELVNLFKELIKRGWKVYGEYDKLMSYGQTRGKKDFGFGVLGEIKYSLRELVSKESGLWQFVCENNLIQTEHCGFIDNGERAKNVFYKVDEYDEEGDIIQTGDMEGDKFIGIYEPEYRLIESALCDEDRLEQFLLYNIKVEGK